MNMTIASITLRALFGRKRFLLLLPLPLLVVGLNVTALDDGADDRERAIVEVASILQDSIVDETGGPWPCVETTEGTTVLEPALVDGRARWTSRGEPWCGIGALVHSD